MLISQERSEISKSYSWQKLLSIKFPTKVFILLFLLLALVRELGVLVCQNSNEKPYLFLDICNNDYKYQKYVYNQKCRAKNS